MTFRHAYASGVFTQEYGETAANILGILNEIPSFSYNSPNTAKSRNMDLWNNSVGRKYGKSTRKRETLAKALHQAMKNGEMILNLQDGRNYIGQTDFQVDSNKSVIVLKESKTGRNELFYDTSNQTSMLRDEFVQLILNGSYPGYRVVNLYDEPTPLSRSDGDHSNNLG